MKKLGEAGPLLVLGLSWLRFTAGRLLQAAGWQAGGHGWDKHSAWCVRLAGVQLCAASLCAAPPDCSLRWRAELLCCPPRCCAAGGEVDDVMAWVSKSRQTEAQRKAAAAERQRAAAEAARRREEEEEEDEEVGAGLCVGIHCGLVYRTGRCRRSGAGACAHCPPPFASCAPLLLNPYTLPPLPSLPPTSPPSQYDEDMPTAAELAGAKVKHSAEELGEGETMILTLGALCSPCLCSSVLFWARHAPRCPALPCAQRCRGGLGWGPLAEPALGALLRLPSAPAGCHMPPACPLGSNLYPPALPSLLPPAPQRTRASWTRRATWWRRRTWCWRTSWR